MLCNNATEKIGEIKKKVTKFTYVKISVNLLDRYFYIC